MTWVERRNDSRDRWQRVDRPIESPAEDSDRGIQFDGKGHAVASTWHSCFERRIAGWSGHMQPTTDWSR